jgi:cytochrome b561
MASTTDDADNGPRSRYSRVAITLHWLIAFLIIGTLLGALVFSGLLTSANPADRAQGLEMLDVHRSFGLTILLLSLVRLAWRLTHRSPPLPATMRRWEVALARGSHLAFYSLLVAVPLAGYVMSSAGPYPVVYFGLFEVPKLPVSETLGALAHGAHGPMALGIVALLVLHVAGALKHHYIDRDEVLARMLPLVRRREPTRASRSRDDAPLGATARPANGPTR